ncbi:hypothetical protein P7H12_20195 [Paenibacillus larvae]|nr:hypothetical protein [Paenibacillus larvae]MDT2265436.1 hypothetical protein [Paenibacillus larvae]
MNGSSHSLDLATMVKMWPTPAAQDAKVYASSFSDKQGYSTWSNAQRWTEGTTKSEWWSVEVGFPIGWTDINGLQVRTRTIRLGTCTDRN